MVYTNIGLKFDLNFYFIYKLYGLKELNIREFVWPERTEYRPVIDLSDLILTWIDVN